VQDLTVKFNALDGKFRPVAAKMGIADEKINVSEKCTYQDCAPPLPLLCSPLFLLLLLIF
jgi:hypothetical protein